MRRLLRDIAEGRTLGDTTTLADSSVVHELAERAKVEVQERAEGRVIRRQRLGRSLAIRCCQALYSQRVEGRADMSRSPASEEALAVAIRGARALGVRGRPTAATASLLYSAAYNVLGNGGGGAGLRRTTRSPSSGGGSNYSTRVADRCAPFLVGLRAQ